MHVVKQQKYLSQNYSIPITEPTSKRMFVPNILLANVMYLTPKIDEIRVFSKSIDIDLFFITETWLKNTIDDNQVALLGYNLERLNRRIGVHGGVCLFSKIGIRATRLLNLESPTLEVMWVHVRPPRLPRGFPCIVTATTYHPPSADDSELLEYISLTLTCIEGNFPGCGIIIAGDFNQLNVRYLCRNFNLKQLVRVPTRGRNTLDLIITNLHSYYQPETISYPPFGLPDHSVIAIEPRFRDPKSNHKKVIYKRNTSPLSIAMFGHYLSQIDWSQLESCGTCEDKCTYFTNILSIGLAHIMPETWDRVHNNGHPWINEKLRNLIKFRQRAFCFWQLNTF